MARHPGRIWIVILLLLACSAGILLSVGDTELVWGVLRTASVVLTAIVPLFYLVVVAMLMSAIPKHQQLTPLLDQPLPDDMAAIDVQFREAGFRRVGGLSQLNTRPKTRILSYVNEERRAYGTVQKLWRNPPAYALITPREDGSGTLETLANPEVDALPAAAGVYRQVIEDADMAALVRHHGEGLAHLTRQGITFQAVHESELENEMAASNRRQRQAIWDRPFYSGWAVVWRTMSGSFPNRGSIADRQLATTRTMSSSST